MAHPNEDLVRAFDAFATGDVNTMRVSTDQDAVWHTPGRIRSRVTTAAKTRSWASLPACGAHWRDLPRRAPRRRGQR